MKWFLLVVVIGLSIFAYNQQKTLSEERLNLQKAQAQIAALETQIQKMKKQNPFLAPPPTSSQGVQGQSKFGGTALDRPKDGGLDRGRK
jgi:hypothetical protein